MAFSHTDGLTSAPLVLPTAAECVGGVVAGLRPKTVTVVGDGSRLTTVLLAHGLTVEPHHNATTVSAELVVMSAVDGQSDDALAVLGAEVARVLLWRADEGSLGELVSAASTRGYFRSAEQPSVDGVTCVLLDAGERTLPQLVARYETLLSEQPMLERQIRELHHQLLTSRDHAIGAEAERAQMRNRHLEQERRIAEIYDSTTWQVGHKLTGSLGKLKRALKR